jgi:hypothetical protein
MIKEIILIVFTATILVGWMKYTMNLKNRITEDYKIIRSYEYFLDELGYNYKPPQLVEREIKEYASISQEG